MPYAAVNGLRLYYEEEGTGPPLVLLSGATMALDSAMRGGWRAYARTWRSGSMWCSSTSAAMDEPTTPVAATPILSLRWWPTRQR